MVLRLSLKQIRGRNQRRPRWPRDRDMALDRGRRREVYEEVREPLPVCQLSVFATSVPRRRR